MSRTVVVRYQTRPDAAEENARLVEKVPRNPMSPLWTVVCRPMPSRVDKAQPSSV
jgi:hypothetical protein